MPGRELPPFLRDFIAMRQQVHKNFSGGGGAVLAGGMPPPPATTGKGTSDGRKVDMGELSVQKIVDEKPPAKELMGYFQKMCDRLTKQKMAE